MFTGIVADVADVLDSKASDKGLILSISRPHEWTDLELGESVATNGACLTVAGLREESYEVELMPETLSKTSFGRSVPDTVNLERSLRAGDRLSGHFVQGHIDDIGKVAKIDRSDGYKVYISMKKEFVKFVIPKGSIAVDGVSLTVAGVNDCEFSIALIPYTLNHTTIGKLQAGDHVNLEFDMIGKYIVNNYKSRMVNT